jgi:hypothetical protein
MLNIAKKIMCRESIRKFELKYKCKELEQLELHCCTQQKIIPAVIVIELYAHQ